MAKRFFNSITDVVFENSKGLSVKKTIMLNMLRSIFASFVFMGIMVFVPYNEVALYIKLLPLILFPLLALVSVGIGQLLSNIYLRGVAKFICLIFTVAGDPFVFLMLKLNPELFPVKNFHVFNFVCLISVYDYDNIPKNITTSSDFGFNPSCSFVGRIVANTDKKVFGFIWPKGGTIFIIDSDWNITSRGLNYGWIDIAGQIRKGKKRNPFDTLSPGSIVGSIESDVLYVDGSEVGRLVKG